MKRRIFIFLIMLCMILTPVRADIIRWVDYDVSYNSMKYAMDVDIETFDQEKHISWIQSLALAACRTGGKCSLSSVKKAVVELGGDQSPEELLGELYQYYSYYYEVYQVVLGGLLGSYALETKDGQWKATYGLKAYNGRQ